MAKDFRYLHTEKLNQYKPNNCSYSVVKQLNFVFQKEIYATTAVVQ